MPQVTDFEKARRRRAKRRTMRNLMVLALFALVVYLFVGLIKQAGEIDLKTAYSDMKAETGGGDGFPLMLPGGMLNRFESANEALVLLTDTNLYTYNASGKQMMNLQHGMANQSMRIARDRILLYDRGGDKLSLLSKSAMISELTAKSTIYTADLAQNGNFAAATGSDERLAHVTVYNKNAAEIFNWDSSRPVISVTLAENRDAMAVGCVDVLDGSFFSSIIRFQFSIEKPMGEIELPGELLLSLENRDGGVCAVTDQRVVLFSNELKEIASYPYTGRTLNRYYSPENGPLTLIFGDYATDKQLTVVTLDSGMRQMSSFLVKYDVTDLKADANYLYLASSTGIEIRSTDGKLAAQEPINRLNRVEPIGDRLYYATNAEIGTLDVKAATAPPEESKAASKTSSADKASASAPESEDGASLEASEASESSESAEPSEILSEPDDSTELQTASES